jgi:CubicO group peptidase (beta-lactamase class C family)
MKKLAFVYQLNATLALVLVMLSAVRATPPTPADRLPSNQETAKNDIDFTELDKIVSIELKERNTPGAVITVVMGDRVVFQKAFGVANVETNSPMQTEMLFRLGSTTKMFTAAAMVRLADQGKLKLNEPIGVRVKGLNERVSQVTPERLLSNSAGVRDFAAPFISNDDDALAKMVRSWKDDVFFADQGDIYSYSSAGFWLSGMVVEDVTGKPYADAMNELLFKPLGMNRTTLRPLLAMTYPLANGHAIENNKPTIIRPFFNNVAMWPAGSIFSNANDLSRWVIAFLNEGRLETQQVLPSSLPAQLATPRIPVPGETDSHYAFGLTAFKFRGVQFVGHGGFSRGYGSMIQMVPSRKFAVIVLTNKSGETMRKSLNKAMELGLGLKDEVPGNSPTATPLTKQEMAEYVGSYSHAPQLWEVSVKDDRLFLKLDGKEYQLTKSSERTFTFGTANENELVFVPGKSGKIDFIFSTLYGAKRVK